MKYLQFVSSDDIPLYSTRLSALNKGVTVSVSVVGWPSGVHWDRKDVERVYAWLGKWLDEGGSRR